MNPNIVFSYTLFTVMITLPQKLQVIEMAYPDLDCAKKAASQFSQTQNFSIHPETRYRVETKSDFIRSYEETLNTSFSSSLVLHTIKPMSSKEEIDLFFEKFED